MNHVSEVNKTGGSYYRDGGIETWDYILSHKLGYLEGNIIKYITRYKKKDGIKDLYKAKHYIEKLIEIEQNEVK